MPVVTIPRLHEIAREVATLLGGKYDDPRSETYPHAHWVNIILPNEDGILSISAPDKLHIGGNWPTEDGTRHGATVTPSRFICPGDTLPVYNSINVSADKTPEQIARDIQRRFLPNYVPNFKACLARRNSMIAHKNGTTQTAERLAAKFPNARLNSERNAFSLPQGITREIGYADVRVNSATSVQIEFRSLPTHIAEALLETYRALSAPK